MGIEPLIAPNRQFALAANWLDWLARFFHTRHRLTSLNLGGGLNSPPGSSPLPDPQLQKSTQQGKKRKKHESIDSIQKNCLYEK